MRVAHYFLASAVALLATTPTHAQHCGMVLTGPVTLTADIVCGPGRDALIVGADKVRIELNGFSITGPDTLANPTGPSIGVRSSGFERVEIMGPGSITGFERAIEIEGGVNHRVSGITALAESGLPISLRDVSGALVELTRMNALELVSRQGSKAVANRILDNEVRPEPGMPGRGLTLAGCGTADNVVAQNAFGGGAADLIHLHEGARSNQILDNKLAQGRVFLDGSSNNLVSGNRFYNFGVMYTGLMIDSSHAPVACARGAYLPGANNIVRNNRFRGGYVGVIVDSSTRIWGSAANVLTGNVFSDLTTVALILGPGSDGNDARGNTYVNNFADVYDYGTANLWP